MNHLFEHMSIFSQTSLAKQPPKYGILLNLLLITPIYRGFVVTDPYKQVSFCR